MKLLVRTVDTDVAVVAAPTLNNTKLDEMCMHGQRLVLVYISRCNACNMAGTLPLFHSLAGCDTESSFAGIGKKTARVTWDVYASSLKHVKN